MTNCSPPIYLELESFIQQVKTWFHNHGRNRKSKDVVKYVRRWNVQQVVGILHQKEVEELCRKQSNAVPGDREYLKSYQKVLKSYAEDLSGDQQTKYQEMANEWSNRSPPQAVQQKWELKINTLILRITFNIFAEWLNFMGRSTSNSSPVSCGVNVA